MLGGAAASAETRTWKTQSGTTIKAEFVRIADDKVVLLRGSRPTLVPFASLSPEDQEYLRELLTKQGKAELIPDVSASPAPSRPTRPTPSTRPTTPGPQRPRSGSSPFETQSGAASSPSPSSGTGAPTVPGLPAGVRSIQEVRAMVGPDATPDEIIKAMFGDEDRVWRDRAGKTIRAKYVRVDHATGMVVLSADGREISVPVVALSRDDQYYVGFRAAVERQLRAAAGESSSAQPSGPSTGSAGFGSRPPMPGLGTNPLGSPSGHDVSGHGVEGEEEEYGSMPSGSGNYGYGAEDTGHDVTGLEEEQEEEYASEATGHDVGSAPGGYGSRPPETSLASAETGHDVGGSAPESYGSPGFSGSSSPQLKPPAPEPEEEYVSVWVCESCGHQFEASDEEVHTGMKCPNCGIVFGEIDRDGDGTYEEKSPVVKAGFYTGLVRIGIGVIVLIASLGGLIAGIKRASS